MLTSKLLIGIIIILGLITSYEDYRFYKIKNKWLLIAFSLGFIILLFNFNFLYFGKVLLNFLLVLIVSFLMWKKNVWAAGDAKLFIVYSFLIPLSFYNNYYLDFFPSFILLINIFVIVLVCLLANSIFFIFSKNYFKLISFKNFKYNHKTSSLLLNIFIIFLLFFTSFDLLNYFSSNHFNFNTSFLQNIFFIFFILFSSYFFKAFSNKKFKRIVIIFLSFFIILSMFWNFYLIIKLIIKTSLTIIFSMIVFMTIQKSVNLYILARESKKIKIKNLREKMIIDKEELNKMDLSNLIDSRPEGVSSRQINIIKERAQKLDKKLISIYPSFPFAFWMFIGVLTTLLIKDSVINYLIIFLKL